MRTLFGMILGAVLTVGAAYVYDSSQTSSMSPSDGSAMAEHRTMVNWDVVGENWRRLTRRARAEWSRLSAG